MGTNDREQDQRGARRNGPSRWRGRRGPLAQRGGADHRLAAWRRLDKAARQRVLPAVAGRRLLSQGTRHAGLTRVNPGWSDDVRCGRRLARHNDTTSAIAETITTKAHRDGPALVTNGAVD